MNTTTPILCPGPHTTALWHAAADTVRAIDALPFLHELARGTLPPGVFVHYLVQDRCYLAGYAKALALLAARTEVRAEARFWAEGAARAIAAEETMHTGLIAHPDLAAAPPVPGGGAPTPTTLGYLSWTVAQAASAPYALGVASVLPCFQIYAHVGANLLAQAHGLPTGHPYRQWIAAYENPAFATATRTALGILERACATADTATLVAIRTTFVQGCRWERRFWADAHALAGWDSDLAA